jgi:hypothetical protein
MAVHRGRRSPHQDRRRIADKHGRLVNAAEEIFAKAMPEEARRYIEELTVRELERCPEHGKVLGCPIQGCGVISQRTDRNH